MILPNHTLFILVLQLVETIKGSNVMLPEDDLICPDGVEANCYPKLFEPSTEWRPVREGQIIPAGLQVRLSLDSDEREAKYVDNYADKKGSKGDNKEAGTYRKPKKHAVAIVESETPLAKGIKYIQELFKNGKIPRKIEYGETLDHLNNLEESSSDIESGVLISKALQSLLYLTGLYDDNNVRSFGMTFRQLNKVKDLSYKILASSFRNNHEAQLELLDHITDKVGFLNRLVNHDDNALVLKSRLGLLGSILNNKKFDDAFIEGNIEKELLKMYGSSTEADVKNRILTILEDKHLEKREEIESKESDFSHLQSDERYAKLLEAQLIKSNLYYDEDAKYFLNLLKSMKLRKDKVFKASNPFLEWLTQEINKAKESKSKRDNSDDFVNELILLRHEVFGNHLGSRKDFDL